MRILYCIVGVFLISKTQVPAQVSLDVWKPTQDVTVTQGDSVAIAWNGSPSGAFVNLRRDDNNADDGSPGEIWIATNRVATGTYSWSTSSVPPGTYYVGGLISSGSTSFWSYATGRVTIRSAQQQAFWKKASSGLADANVYCVAVSPLNGNIFAGTETGVYRSNNSGNSWGVPPNAGISPAKDIVFNAAGHLFADVSGDIYRSTDNGNNWQSIGYFSFPYVAPSQVLYVADAVFHCIYRSTDNGSNWIVYGVSTTTSYGVNNFLSFATNTGNPFYVGTDGAGIYKSTDFCQNWSQTNQGLPENEVVSSILMKSNTELFIGTSGDGVFHTTNGGDTWTQLNMGSANPVVYSISKNAKGHLYVGTLSGAYRSTDNGITWEDISAGLEGSLFIRRIAFDSAGFAYAADVGSGLFRSSNSTPVKERKAGIITDYLLHQNFPNPFNPTTTIDYQLPNRSYVELRVFNEIGESIRTLASTIQEAGNKSVAWDGKNDAGVSVSSGIYFYRLVAGNYIKTNKMLLLR